MTQKWQRNDKKWQKNDNTNPKWQTQMQKKCNKNAKKWQNNYFGISNVCRPKIFLTLGGMFLLRPKPRWPVFDLRTAWICSVFAEGLQLAKASLSMASMAQRRAVAFLNKSIARPPLPGQMMSACGIKKTRGYGMFCWRSRHFSRCYGHKLHAVGHWQSCQTEQDSLPWRCSFYHQGGAFDFDGHLRSTMRAGEKLSGHRTHWCGGDWLWQWLLRSWFLSFLKPNEADIIIMQSYDMVCQLCHIRSQSHKRS